MENNTSFMSSPAMRRTILAVAVLLGLLLFAQAVKTFKSISYVGKDVAVMNTISVSGKGEAFALPDIATFSFTVQEESLVVSQAQDKVNKQVADILAYLKKSGIADKDIKTLGYNVYPRYEYNEVRCITYPCPSGNRYLAGYTVSQTISVKVRTIADSGKIVSGVGELGATELSGLQFGVDEEEGVLREARQEAIRDAQEKANELAKDLGVKLVRIVSFSEGGNYPMYYAKTEMAVGIGGGAPARDAALPTGENQFISNISITYEIR